MDLNNAVKIHMIESIFEMDMLRDALDQENIEYEMKEYHDTAYDGLFILQKGYASLYVYKADQERALEIVRRIRTLPYVAYSKD